MTPHPAFHRLGPIPREMDESDRQLSQILARCFDAVTRAGAARARPQGEADPPSDLLSASEVLTIEQFGFPRSYNLNDGMGPDIAIPA
jgi:hypothetical protein